MIYQQCLQKKTGCFFHGHTNLRASHDSLTQESFHRNASADHLRPCWKNLQMKGFKELKKNIHQNQTKKRLTYINYVMCHSVFDDLGINLWPFSICVIAEAAVFFWWCQESGGPRWAAKEGTQLFQCRHRIPAKEPLGVRWREWLRCSKDNWVLLHFSLSCEHVVRYNILYDGISICSTLWRMAQLDFLKPWHWHGERQKSWLHFKLTERERWFPKRLYHI